MASLFTDGPIANLSDLRAYESSILDVATTERVDAAAKLRVAQSEIGVEIATFLRRRGFPETLTHSLTGVVATDALVNAHALHALALVFRDAYNGQLNERYKSKWQAYVALAERALQNVFSAGVGIVFSPIAKAAVPQVARVSGGVLPARAYSVKIALIGGSGAAGESSDAAVAEIDGGHLVRVAPPGAVPDARGWIVYGGETGGALCRQTPVPLDWNTSWTEPISGLRNDLPLWAEQEPDLYVANNRRLLRG